jgi:hypothetical protein
MRLFPGRRASEAQEEATINLPGLLIGGFFLLILFIVMINLLGIFDKADQGTVNQFNSLYDSIEVLFHPSNTEPACKLPIGYIEPNFAVVGFNEKGQLSSTEDETDSNGEFIEEHCGIDDNIYKPESCFNDACLCLCSGGTGDVTGEDCSSATCKRLPGEVRQLVTDYDGSPVDLVLYGESCWSGSDHETLAGYTVTKSNGLVTIKEYKDAPTFNALQLTDCDVLKKKFVKTQAAPVEEKTGTAVTETLDEAGQGPAVEISQ